MTLTLTICQRLDCERLIRAHDIDGREIDQAEAARMLATPGVRVRPSHGICRMCLPDWEERVENVLDCIVPRRDVPGASRPASSSPRPAGDPEGARGNLRVPTRGAR